METESNTACAHTRSLRLCLSPQHTDTDAEWRTWEAQAEQTVADWTKPSTSQSTEDIQEEMDTIGKAIRAATKVDPTATRAATKVDPGLH